jgi:sugar lactone lactonase YvrE
MKNSYGQLLRGFLFALVIAAGFVTIKVVAEDVCDNPLACFEVDQEGEIWQALTPFGQTNDPSCTNSLHPDGFRNKELPRQCMYAPHTQLMPPKLGQMMDPFMLAVDGERIYVSDQSNHRIQVFKFDGTPIPLAHPIGDGVPGSGPYPAYPAEANLTGHTGAITGVRLNSPDGLAVDANHRLIVADVTGAVNVFNPDGSPAFGSIASPLSVQLPAHPFSYGTQATGIAMTPGTIVHGINVEPPVGDNNRIIVTDRMSSFVYLYDSGFRLIKRIPEAIPEGAEANSACMWAEDAPLGTFCTPVSAVIDSSGRIYISEYDNNRIQVLDSNGTPLGYFGSADLQYPWGITLDHRGRLVVADTLNQRFAFFDVTFPGGVPTGTYLFELDAEGTLNGEPTGIVEQVGNAAGLDPAGRFLVTDTLNNRVQRFQLPDLAILNPQIDIANGTGTFQVGVPAAKAAAVANVGVSVIGVNASVLTLNGVSPANTAVLNPLDSALQNATEALGTDMSPGQVATYAFTFDVEDEAAVAFVFDAVGNGGATSANPKEVNAESPCLTCESVHTVFKTPVSAGAATMSNGWYNTPLTVRVNASTTNAAGLAGIAFQFLSGPEAGSSRWGGLVHTIPVSGLAAATDITVISEGISRFRYWAIGADGTVEESHFLTLSLDLVAPSVSYSLTPAANAAGWNNTNVDGAYVKSDARSGPVLPATGTFSFPNEGRGFFVEQTASDLAGNTTTPAVRSDVSAAGGRPVNIDKTAPIIDPLTVPGNIVIPATGANFGVIPSLIPFAVGASDPDLADLRPGADVTPSGIVHINNPGTYPFPVGVNTWSFTATDAAGNVSTEITRTVTVEKVPSTLTAAGATITYGDPLSINALVGPAFAQGSVVFKLNGGPSTTVPLSGGGASLPLVNLGAGTHTLVIEYPGSPSVLPSSETVTITVNARPITVTADDYSKPFGGADPVLTYKVTSGSLVTGDAFTGNLTRDAGELPGLHTIRQGSLLLSNNYALTFVEGHLSIGTFSINVFTDQQNKIYGNDDPAKMTFHTDVPLPTGVEFQGKLGRTAGETIGNYTINQGTLSLPSGFDLHFHAQGRFEILHRGVTVRAGDTGKVFGQADPTTFPVTSPAAAGFLASDNITTSATRVAGENAGTYSTLAHAFGAALSNYSVGLESGTFTITPAVVTVTPIAKEIVYGDAEPTFDVIYSGFPSGYSAANVMPKPTCGVAGAHTNAGTYTITCSGGAVDLNVVLDTTATAQLTVKKKPITLVIDDASRNFGADNPAFTAAASGLVGTDSLAYSLGTTAGTLANVGDYAITASFPLGSNPNYAVTPDNGTLTVNQATVTVSADSTSKNFGAPLPPLTATVSGAVAGVPVVYNVTTTATQTSAVGTYLITVTPVPGANPNYNVLTATGTLTILALTNQPPVCGNATGGEIWPPNHKKFQVAPINGVTDPEGDPITLVVTGILQDEHVDSTGDGQFSPDGVGVGTSTASLRAERNGHGNKAKGDGRVYQISFTASAGGGTCTGTVLYTVPHDQGQGGAAVNSGLIYDSTVTVPGTKNKK